MLRTVIVVGLSAFFVGLTVPNIWLPTGGSLGTSVDSRFRVLSVIPGSLPDAAGIRAGDQIDPSSTTMACRAAFKNTYLLREGEALRFNIVRDGVERTIVITQPAIKTGDYVLGVIKRTSASLFIITAATLLLMRPSGMLWGFFLFALGSTHGQPLILKWVNYDAGVLGSAASNSTFDILGTLGLLLFGTSFPERSSHGVRVRIARWIPAIVGLVVLAQLPFALFIAGVPSSPALSVIADFIPAAAYTLGIVALLAGFFESDGAARQRLRWVIAGFGVYCAAVIYLKLEPLFPDQAWPASWSNSGLTYDALNGLVIFIPITVAYAVLRHHVLDLNFVIGRGLVYGILTSIAVAIFAVIEWFVGGVLAQTKLAAIGEVIAAIAVGFWLNSLHRQIDRFVDAVIFRRRHAAEQRLNAVVAGLPHARSADTVARMLVDEPADALGLSPAALLRRDGSGRFHCERTVGVDGLPDLTATEGDSLSVRLHGARSAVSMRQAGSSLDRSAPAYQAFVVALPVFIRHELAAVAFYGAHETGEAIDPDEMRALEALCVAAAAAFDHLEAADLRARLEESQRMIETLRAAQPALEP